MTRDEAEQVAITYVDEETSFRNRVIESTEPFVDPKHGDGFEVRLKLSFSPSQLQEVVGASQDNDRQFVMGGNHELRLIIVGGHVVESAWLRCDF
ncbi:MAG: hypothetical protein AAF497_13505 [Planctomycetota bacterium]